MGTSRSTLDSVIPRAPHSSLVIPIHTAVPGRARFKVAGLYRSLRVKRLLEAGLLTHQAIKSADANLLTGNVLVTFDPSYDVGEIATIIAHAIAVDASKNDVGSSRMRKKGSFLT
jgi:Ca2+-transporting ATPase